MSQEFGGPWSLLKLETVQKYLEAYSTLMREKPNPSRPFKRVYIDAFAGSGYFSFGEDTPATLLDEAKSRDAHKGSALRALEVKPPFDQLWFIDKSATNIDALRSAIGPDARVQFRLGDANEMVSGICQRPNWRQYRGVIFLDPYGTSVEWRTLEIIRQTQALDLWYLFPIAGLYRNAPRRRDALTEDKKQTVTRLLGYDGWADDFYIPSTSQQATLFNDPQEEVEQRELNVADMERIVKKRLETIFPHVEAPGRLLGPSNAPLYSLFFAVSNPSAKVIELAGKIARDLLKPLRSDIRPKSGHPVRGRS